MWHRPRHLHSLLTWHLHGGKWMIWPRTHPGIGFLNRASAPVPALVAVAWTCPFTRTTSTAWRLSPLDVPFVHTSGRRTRIRIAVYAGRGLIRIVAVVPVVVVPHALTVLRLLGITRGTLIRCGTHMGPA